MPGQTPVRVVAVIPNHEGDKHLVVRDADEGFCFPEATHTPDDGTYEAALLGITRLALGKAITPDVGQFVSPNLVVYRTKSVDVATTELPPGLTWAATANRIHRRALAKLQRQIPNSHAHGAKFLADLVRKPPAADKPRSMPGKLLAWLTRQ